jgi:hypothetical protein
MTRRGCLRFWMVGLLAWAHGNPALSSEPGPKATPAVALAKQVQPARALGVCPPFKLRDEKGREIDPVKKLNATEPYSPKQTCGQTGCHDYAKITRGFHFTQGKGEALPPEYARRYQWVSFPGNYGGNWCSPAPLYRQLAPKKNASARTIDMTSFEFVTATCGNCHPGGGPLEYDRDGHRYDERMRDPAAGLVPGGDNGFDGDYYKALWSKTGVIEADCLLCHMPGYGYAQRNDQLARLNFRWAATAGAGFGTIVGEVKAGQTPTVRYDPARFQADGTVKVHIAPEPRNETCLNCHFKPDWKKRGASYSPRTDVHAVAGLRCVDCHAAGSRSADPRIRDREEHQFGKGDDPSGWVRNDLDNTVRSCESCHLQGWRNSPRARHDWLPPLHLEKLSCQACHIPARTVKSALVQASDIFNPAPRISPPAKHIWAFYDQERVFWNHYGELDLFTGKDMPTNVSRPTLARYKGKIYPVNQVHSAWVGFEEEGKPGLNQLFMRDFFMMWMQHRGDPKNKYPELAAITDDDHDGLIEVNRPEEIDALLAATRRHLTETGFPLAGRRLVWVSDSRAHYSSKESRELPREAHEATAYASVYKYSHDVAPARAALGSGGCIDCHRLGSSFFEGRVLSETFSAQDGRPRWVPNHATLGISPAWVTLGFLREQWVKPALYGLLFLLLALLCILGLKSLAVRGHVLSPRPARAASLLLALCAVAGAVAVALSPDLVSYMVARRFTLDANHFWVAVVLLGVAVALGAWRASPEPRSGALRVLEAARWILVVLVVLSGGLMLLGASWLETVTRLSYTVFDLGLALLGLVAMVDLVRRIASAPAP